MPAASVLAISGGGATGAFGAGLLCGWTETGNRPEFKVVTGISTGALIAPFAFVERGEILSGDFELAIARRENAGDQSQQGAIKLLKGVEGDGEGMLLIDDLVDTGKTARYVREILPKAHFATIYAKPAGKPLVDTFVTEVSQDTWIRFPWLRRAPSRASSIRSFTKRLSPCSSGSNVLIATRFSNPLAP